VSIVVVPKYHRLGEGFSRAEQMKAMEAPGRRTKAKGYQSPASYICDVADSKQGVLLCDFCSAKFNPRRNRHRKRFTADLTGKSSGFTVNGTCDACKQNTALCGGGTFFVPEEIWHQVSMDPTEARRRARAVWQFEANRQKRKRVLEDYRDNPNKFGSKKVTIPVTDKRRFAK